MIWSRITTPTTPTRAATTAVAATPAQYRPLSTDGAVGRGAVRLGHGRVGGRDRGGHRLDRLRDWLCDRLHDGLWRGGGGEVRGDRRRRADRGGLARLRLVRRLALGRRVRDRHAVSWMFVPRAAGRPRTTPR